MITKEQFLSACNNHPPNAWIRFAYKYLSKETTKEDAWLVRLLTRIMLTLFGVGIVMAAIGLEDKWIVIPTIPFGIILFLEVITIIGAGVQNNIRIRLIAIDLGITVKKYNEYAAIWL